MVKEDTEVVLQSLRQRIHELDGELVRLAAERVRLARQIGEIKRRRQQPTVDYAQERRVLDRGRREAETLGLPPELAEELLARLIRESVTVQEEDSLLAAATGKGKRAVVVGGAGRMGRWFVAFLEAQGWGVAVQDPAAAAPENRRAASLLPVADLIVAATPPGVTAERYRGWCAAPPQGIVVDLSSIKTPLMEPIRALREAGARVASIHPMFGPSTVLLRDADVVICETGDEEATALVEDLFRATTAHRVRLPLEDHDQIMGDLLSLGHAAAIAFALALPEDEHPVRSTTFLHLEKLAAAVVRESPDLYYEIQADNPHSLQALEKLRVALERIRQAAEERLPAEFRKLMEEGQRRTRVR